MGLTKGWRKNFVDDIDKFGREGGTIIKIPREVLIEIMRKTIARSFVQYYNRKRARLLQNTRHYKKKLAKLSQTDIIDTSKKESIN